LRRYSSLLNDEDETREELERIKSDIDFLYNLVHPPPDILFMDHLDYGVTMQITEEIYDKLIEYSENKDNIFIGIS